MGFLAPWFFAGLVALGIPVLVHLLRHNAHPPRPVSSLMFFERGLQSSTRHRRLKHLLLFALRCALVLLLAAAFANPFIRRADAHPNHRLLLIVLDRSFSMSAGTRFSDARQQALSLLAAKPPAQKAQIVALGGQAEILTQPISDQGQLRAVLAGIQPEEGRADFGELSHVVRSLAESAHSPVDVHLFSDMQRDAMPANFADAVLPQNARLLLHSVARSTAPNWTIENVEAPAALSDPKDPHRSHVRAVVAGFNTPAANKTVTLIVNGTTVATRTVDVPANGRAVVDFAPLSIGYGWNRCEVRMDAGDVFAGDDASLFAVRRSDPERVLFVHADSDVRSPLYFGAALQAAAQGSFEIQSLAAGQARDIDPSKYAFVVLSDPAGLPSMFQHALAQYVEHGGGVMIALGPAAARSGEIPLWPGSVRTVEQDAGNPVTVGQVDATFPALSLAQVLQNQAGWDQTKFFYSAVVASEQAKVVMRLSDGTPLLIDRQAGQGHVLLFASGFDNLTNDLPLHPVFVAFVDRIARYLSGMGEIGGSRLVDSFIQLRSASASGNYPGSVEVVDPAGRRPLSLTEARTLQTFQLHRAGFYHIRLATGRDLLIGVNPDRRESDLEPLSAEMQQLWSGQSGRQQNGAIAGEAGGAERRSTTFWWWIMLLALAVAGAEMVLASRYMGTQRDEL